jgi:hypothetical protein
MECIASAFVLCYNLNNLKYSLHQIYTPYIVYSFNILYVCKSLPVEWLITEHMVNMATGTVSSSRSQDTPGYPIGFS